MSMKYLAAGYLVIICASLLVGLPNFLPNQNPKESPTKGQTFPIQLIANSNTAQILTVQLNTKQTNIPMAVAPEDVASLTDNFTTYWMNLAKTAWNYFQPGNGVYYATGLHYADLDYPYFTDWDLGAYIQAIIDADKLGLTSPVGWDTNSRLNKVLTFLENRPLMPERQPYAWYSAVTGLNIEPRRSRCNGRGKFARSSQESGIIQANPESANRQHSVQPN